MLNVYALFHRDTGFDRALLGSRVLDPIQASIEVKSLAVKRGLCWLNQVPEGQ